MEPVNDIHQGRLQMCSQLCRGANEESGNELHSGDQNRWMEKKKKKIKEKVKVEEGANLKVNYWIWHAVTHLQKRMK